MERMSGSNASWLGAQPEAWESKLVCDVATVSSGGTPDRGKPQYWAGNIPWVTTSQVCFSPIQQSDEYITKRGLDESATRLYPSGTVLLAMYGQGKTRGSVAILGIDAAINQACAAIQPREPEDAKFLFYWLSSQYEQIRLLSNTGNQDNLNAAIVRSIQVPWPTPQERARIVRILAGIDELDTSLVRMTSKKQVIKQALAHDILTGRRRLPGFSSLWTKRPFRSLATIRSGQVDPRRQPYSAMVLVAPDHIESGTGRLIEMQTAADQHAISGKYLFSRGDVLYSKIRPYLQKATLATFCGICSADMYPLTPADDVEARFLLGIVLGEAFTELACNVSARTGIPKVNRSDLSNIVVHLPPIEEQQAIATLLSDMDAEIAALEARLAKTRVLKQAMMQELLTGRIRLT